jgi:endosialidase-like protein
VGNLKNWAMLLSTIFLFTGADAQITPLGDAYTNSADPTTNYGSKTLLYIDTPTETTYIQFNLASIPSSYTAATISQATLKLYVSAVTKAGSFNVNLVNGSWSESTIAYDNAPALGSTIASSIPLTTADKNQYILINVTAAVQAWLSGTANNGIALVANSPLNASFDSKETTSTSHSAELDIVFAGGALTGIDTADGSGLMGGGTSGTLNLSLLNTCASGQVLAWSGSAWACATVSGRGSTAWSSITAPTATTSIPTGTFTTTFTEGDFGTSPVSSAFGITDSATSSTDDSFDLTAETGNNSYHNALSVGVTTGGTYYPQLEICNNGSEHVGASLFGNTLPCSALSSSPNNKVTITDNTAGHTGLAVLNNSSAEMGTMVRLLAATPTTGSYNFLTACAGTTALDKLCNGTIVATLTGAGAFSVAGSVTAPEFCIGSDCITSWPSSRGNGDAGEYAGGSWEYSDERLKNLDGVYSSGLSQILQINPVRFRYKPDNAAGIHDESEHVGVVAEDVQEVIPEAVQENNEGYLLVNKDRIVWAMLNAIKEQQQLLDEQKELIQTQRAQLAAQQAKAKSQDAQIAELKAQVNAIRASLKLEPITDF